MCILQLITYYFAIAGFDLEPVLCLLMLNTAHLKSIAKLYTKNSLCCHVQNVAVIQSTRIIHTFCIHAAPLCLYGPALQTVALACSVCHLCGILTRV